MAVVLILGAKSDIAIAIADIYAKNGSDQLYLAGRNAHDIESISKHLKIKYGTISKAYEFDAEQYDSHEEFYQSLDPKPDIIYCVFGYLGDQFEAQKTWSECERIINVNYTGAVSILNIIANDFERRGSGIIVGISSVAGERGKMTNYLYGSAKAGFTAYLSGLRNRLYHLGVHVITVKPGFVDTRMTEGKDLPKPLTGSPMIVASQIIKAVNKRKNTIYTLKRWRWVMLIIKNIPEFIFKRLKL